jgi:hypothetical protein
VPGAGANPSIASAGAPKAWANISGTGACSTGFGTIRSPGAGANGCAPGGRPNTAASAGETVCGGAVYRGGSTWGAKLLSTPGGRA